MDWINLESPHQLVEIVATEQPVLIFKHSTRCSISRMVKKTFEEDAEVLSTVPTYYLDLLEYRSISDQIATDFSITHQSPQVLLVQNGTCIYSASHEAIDAAEIARIIARN